MSQFIKEFEQLGYRYSWMEVFSDFLSLSICAFGMQRYEEEYKSVIGRYPKEDQAVFPSLFAEMFKAYEDGSSTDGSWTDMLGDFYMEFGSRSTHQFRGQFFTPPSICQMMALLTVDELKYGTNINDCACGSGRTLIAVARLNPDNRLKVFFVGQDLDITVCKMAVINFVMFGMAGVIIHMDTIRMEVYGGWRIFLPETGLGVVKLTKEEALMMVTERKQPEGKEEPASPEPIAIQLIPQEDHQKYKQLQLF